MTNDKLEDIAEQEGIRDENTNKCIYAVGSIVGIWLCDLSKQKKECRHQYAVGTTREVLCRKYMRE